MGEAVVDVSAGLVIKRLVVVLQHKNITNIKLCALTLSSTCLT
jgi:hypothetical protein